MKEHPAAFKSLVQLFSYTCNCVSEMSMLLSELLCSPQSLQLSLINMRTWHLHS